jgi:hypothetical protein
LLGVVAVTAGEALRARWDAALFDYDASLSWDEAECHHLEAAARAADRIELLQKQLDAEAAGENRPTVLVKISAELRALDRAVGDHLGRVTIGEGAGKSPQHQAAANARWTARRAEHEAARVARGY